MLQRVKSVPPLKALRKSRYKKLFLSPRGFTRTWGVFSSFEEARASISTGVGFDQPVFTKEYDDRIDNLYTYDYPVLFWLQKILRSLSHPNVLDIGGSVGVHFLAYQRFIEFPKDLIWTVLEVPEIAKEGDRRAREADEPRLRFLSDWESLRDTEPDLVLSEGALQYIEGPLLWNAIRTWKKPPRHLLFNKLPLYHGSDFVMLQNIGHGCFSPVYVWNRKAFISKFEELGYEQVDFWRVHERTNYMFDDPDRSFSSYSGLYLRLS